VDDPWKGSPRRILRGHFAILLLGMLSACATVDYLPPRQGTSADLQRILSQSLEFQMARLAWEPQGRTVDLQVRAWGGFQQPLGLEKYIRSLFQEWLIQRGGKIGAGDLQMTVLVSAFGSGVTRRDLSFRNIPLYYSEDLDAALEMAIWVRDRDGGLLHFWKGQQKSDTTDAFLMRFLGPLH
jgi:hypothetical protein